MENNYKKSWTKKRRSEFAKRKSEWFKSLTEDEKKEYSKRCSKGTIKRYKKDGDEIKKRISNSCKAKWKDPEYKKRMSEQRSITNKKNAKKISATLKKYWSDPEKRKQRSILCKRVMNTEKVRKNFSNERKRRYSDPKKLRKLILQGALQKHPNKKELFLIDFFKRKQLPFKYVGNGDLIVERKVPDFVSFDGKSIIEYFGSYWHDNPKQEHRTEQGTINHYSKHGYRILILKKEDLENEIKLEDKVKELIKELEGDKK